MTGVRPTKVVDIANLTEAHKRELGRIAGLAYERELAAALSALEQYFRRWRAGEIKSHDVSDAIEAFHQGKTRKLWSQYYNGGDNYLVAVAAVGTGIVKREEVAADLLKIMEPSLALHEYKSTSMRPPPD